MNHSTRKLATTGILVALGIILPMAFHAIPRAGMIFLPMHLPVLICGLLCGPAYGAACGVLAPLLSSLLTSMPPAPVLPGMLCELAVYGLVAGLAMRKFASLDYLPRVFCSLLVAMLSGRLVAGLTNALIFQAGQYSFSAWIQASFVTALPGIAIQIVLIPLLLKALEKSGATRKLQGD